MRFSFPLCGFSLSFCMDGFRLLYAGIAVLMWTVSLLFTPRYFRGHAHTGRYYFFTVLTFFATVGVFLSDDLLCTFIFFEIMSFSSYPWVAQEETPGALRAAGTYLAVAVFGGMVTLMGLFLLYHQTGTLSFEGLKAFAAASAHPEALYLPAALTFVGFAAKAGVFPLHIWLPKAHPVAPAPASALLSGILTKSGVFGMIVLSCNLFSGERAWGNALLLLALPTMVIGALRAVFSTDLKHTLACSSMSQIGFILTGLAFTVLLGEENALAARGTLLHMVNHSLIKLDLFLCAGAVYMNTHRLDLTGLRGYGRRKPLLHFCFLMGYLGIIGMPLFNGYLSKSLIHEAILEYAGEAASDAVWYSLCEKLFLLSGGLTAAYMTKLYLCLFFFKNRDPKLQQTYDAQRKTLSPASGAALLLAALLPPVIGLLPDLTATPLLDAAMPFLGGAAHPAPIAWFSAENLEGAAISLAVGGLVCLLIHRLLVRGGAYLARWPAWLDLEESLYRPLVLRVLPAIGGALASLANHAVDNPLLRVRLPAAAAGLTRGLEHAVENPLVLRWLPGAVTRLVRGMERAVENPLALRWLPEAVTRLVRGLDDAVDALATALHRSLFRAQKLSDHSLSPADQLLLAEGNTRNRLSALFSRVLRRRSRRPATDHVARAFSLKEEVFRTDQYISRSISWGLLLLCLGLCAMLIYLLVIQQAG